MMKILIVDNKHEGRFLLESFLASHGYQTFSAANGKQALEILESTLVDLIITDILMPEMDGYALCQRVKSDPRWTKIPVIFYTATFTSRQDEIFAIKLGAAHFVRKPAEPESFLKIIQNILDNQGRTIGAFGVSQDITERKRMQEMIAKEQQELKLIIDTSPMIIFYKDKEGRFIRVNRKFAKMLRMNEADFLGKTVFDLYTKEIAQSMTDDDREVLESNRPKLNIVEKYQSASGLRWVQTDKIPIHDEDGNPVGLIGFAQDITNLKQVEQNLIAERDLLQRVTDGLSSVEIGIDIIDDNYRIHYQNSFLKNRFGDLTDELCYEKYMHLKEPCPSCPMVKAIATKLPQKVEITGADGKIYELFSAPLPDPDGTVNKVIEIVVDITERKKAEEAIRESEKHYRELIDGMNETVWIIDFNGNLIDVNRTALETLGYSKQELLKIGLFGIDSTLKREDIKALAKSMIKDKIQIFETSHKAKDGRTFPVEIYSSLIDYHGKPAILNIARDITERKQAEEDLNRIMEGAQAILWHSPVVRQKDAKDDSQEFLWQTRYFNLDAIKNTIPLPDYPTHNPHDMYYYSILEEDRRNMDKVSSIALKSGAERYDQEFRLRDARGVVHWMHEDARIRQIDESHYEVVGVITEVTERKKAEEELAANYALLNLAGETARFGGWSTDLVNNIVTWSDIVADIHEMPRGYSPTLQEGINFYAPEWREKIAQVFNDCVKKGVPYDEEMEIITKNGKRVWVRTTGEAIRDEHGKIVTVLGSFQDITERKKAEEELKVSEEKFKDLFEYIRSGVVIYEALNNGADFIIRDFNKASESIEKIKREKVIGKNVTECFPGVKDFGLLAVLQRVWRTGKPESFPLTLYSDEQITGWRENYVFKLPSGEVVAVYDDVTQQKLAEEERLKSERYFRLVWENSVDGMRLADENGTVVMVNDTYCNIVNLPKEKLEGQPFTVIYTEEKRAENLEHYLQRFKGMTEQSNFEMEMILYDGQKVWFSLSDSYLEISPGKRLLLTIIRDITEQKTRQLEQEELQAQLTQSQKMEAIGNLAGGVAHDFNNLLTVIQGHAQLLMLDKNENDPDYQGLKHIVNAASKASILTRQLLLFSRKNITEFRPVDFNEIITNLLKMIMRLIGENIKIDTNLEKPLWNIEADESNLEQVIVNLIVNARDAMPNGGLLTIKTSNNILKTDDCQSIRDSRPGRFVCLEISDTGSGIPAVLLDKIFDPFFTTKEEGKGTGLGLSVVYGIVKKHNGWINVYSDPGRGTAFKLYFPVTEKTVTKETESSQEQVEYIGNGEKILFVEDNNEVRKFIEAVLHQKGYLPIAAATAAQAIELFRQEEGKIDMVVSDVILPDKNGVLLAEEILKIKSNIPILFSSGYAEETLIKSIKTNPKFHFLQKPYEVRVLLEQIYKILREN